jgi:hypothetical protein
MKKAGLILPVIAVAVVLAFSALPSARAAPVLPCELCFFPVAAVMASWAYCSGGLGGRPGDG